MYYFFEETDDSFDIVYVGSSNVYAHFNSTLAYNQYGFTTGLLSADTQSFVFVKYLIKEAQKTQSPQLYIIDIAKLVNGNDYIREETVRKTADMMPFNINRINEVSASLKLSLEENIPKSEYMSYYLSYLKYHNVWKQIEESNFKVTKLYKGYLFDSGRAKTVSQTKFEWVNTCEKLPDQNEEILVDLLEYINENNINVLFVIPSRYFAEEEMQYLNYAMNIIETYNYQVINFNNKEYGLDYSNDFYNANHINVYGATKYTLYFSEYLTENYDLPDHREDSLYDSWDSEYNRFKENYLELTGNSFEELLNNYYS